MPNSELVSLIKDLAVPLHAETTGVQPRLKKLQDIRAVIFDIYGTLIISGSGDIGTVTAAPQAMADAISASEAVLKKGLCPEDCVQWMQDFIREEQSRLRTTGSSHPEIEIREIWQRLVQTEIIQTQSSPPLNFIESLAIHYEMRVNPVACMPSSEECLAELRRTDMRLGIVSNAQFLTPLVVEALFGRDLGALGFDSKLVIYSYQFLHAKPGRFLFDQLAERLAEVGIAPCQTLYIGNDMLNDVTTAKAAGYRTALFAGDARSLRLRSEDSRVHGVIPDLVVTDLAQILHCVLGTVS